MTQSQALAAKWIVSPRYDLTFFIGSCVLSLLFYGIYAFLQTQGVKIGGDSIIVTYFIFTALLDHPHIFQTFARTHADKEEFKRHRFAHTWGLALFILVGFLFVGFNLEAYLIVGAAIYGTWHIMRQHFGFLKIYRHLNKDTRLVDVHLENLTFWFGMLSCFFYDYSGMNGPLVIYGNLAVSFPNLPSEIGETGRAIFFLLVIGMIVRTIIRWRQGLSINLPKLLLMTAALGTHYWIFFVTATPFLVAEAIETAYHNAQYQGLVMHYQRNRFPNVKGVVAKWFGAAMLYGVIIGTIEIYGLLKHDWAMWLFAPFAMIVVWHYYIDGKIWRVSEAPELRSALFHR